jgi:hypothetical protein
LAGTLAILTEVFPDFSQSLQKNAGTVPLLGPDCFLPDALKFIIYLLKLLSVTHTTPGGKGWPACKADNLTTIYDSIV